jgi:hypothetical protein
MLFQFRDLLVAFRQFEEEVSCPRVRCTFRERPVFFRSIAAQLKDWFHCDGELMLCRRAQRQRACLSGNQGLPQRCFRSPVEFPARSIVGPVFGGNAAQAVKLPSAHFNKRKRFGFRGILRSHGAPLSITGGSAGGCLSVAGNPLQLPAMLECALQWLLSRIV